jgi:hypothetical protein
MIPRYLRVAIRASVYRVSGFNPKPLTSSTLQMLDSDGDESAPLVSSRRVTGTGCPPNVIAIDVLPDGTFRRLVKYGRVRYVLEVSLEQLVRNPVLYFVKFRIRH